MCGDFNVPGINWEDYNYLGRESSLAASLLDATNDVNLFQHITGFTRHRCCQRSSPLDLVSTVDSNSIYFVHHHSPLGSSDQECLTWQYECLPDNPTVVGTSTTFNYWKGRYLAMYQEFDRIDWELLLSNHSIDFNRDLFKEKVASVTTIMFLNC